jgi:hypothetical protein
VSPPSDPCRPERDVVDAYAGALAALPDEAANCRWLRDLRDQRYRSAFGDFRIEP